MSAETSISPARNRAVWLLGFAGICWGTGGLAGLLLADLAGLAPAAVATYRLLTGGAVLLALAHLSGEKFCLPRTSPAFVRIATAGLLLAVFQAAYFAAAATTSVSLTTLTVMVSVTVMVTVGTAILERRRIRGRTAAAVVVALLGLVLLLGQGTRGVSFTGGALALISAAGFATLTLDRRDPPTGLSRKTFTALSFLTGGLILLPLGLWTGMAVPAHPQVLGALVYLGLVPTALAYAAYFTGLNHAGPSSGVVAVLLEPLTATLLAAVLLAERLSVTQWFGAAFVTVAITLLSIPPGKSRS